MTNTTSSFETLLVQHQTCVDAYKVSSLLQLIVSPQIADNYCRMRMLDSIQILSNFFQKVIMLRAIFTDNPRFTTTVLTHLQEEFCHHEQLMNERNHRPGIWDPILESTCSWFAWKMLNTNDEEKLVLVHMVLESAAHAFFQLANPVMQQYKKHDYFTVHSHADELHEHMGRDLLHGLSAERYQRLMELHMHGWSVMTAACDRIASLATVSDTATESIYS